MNILDLQMHSRNGTRSYVGDLLYIENNKNTTKKLIDEFRKASGLKKKSMYKNQFCFYTLTNYLKKKDNNSMYNSIIKLKSLGKNLTKKGKTCTLKIIRH